jgi:hypothetical protein
VRNYDEGPLTRWQLDTLRKMFQSGEAQKIREDRGLSVPEVNCEMGLQRKSTVWYGWEDKRNRPSNSDDAYKAFQWLLFGKPTGTPVKRKATAAAASVSLSVSDACVELGVLSDEGKLSDLEIGIIKLIAHNHGLKSL